MTDNISKLPDPSRRISVAPMMDWTDRHDRYFLRLISKHALLYTEMVTTGALIHGDRHRHLHYDDAEHPIALQLGGSDPQALADCMKWAEDYAYDEVNLNVGCPSDRVQSGKFGACLMAEPGLVADCIAAMDKASPLPVTVKCRIGIDDQDDWQDLYNFIKTVHENGGCTSFTIHARKAWLQGLSPKENRDIPPLNYDLVYRLKETFPALEICINGGIVTLEAAADHLQHVDGVMIGRAAYQNPYVLAEADRLFYGDDHPIPTRRDIAEQMVPYIDRRMDEGVPLKSITRHILGLYNGMPGAKQWRRMLSDHQQLKDRKGDILLDAVEAVEDAARRTADIRAIDLETAAAGQVVGG